MRRDREKACSSPPHSDVCFRSATARPAMPWRNRAHLRKPIISHRTERAGSGANTWYAIYMANDLKKRSPLDMDSYLGWKIDFANPLGAPALLGPDSVHWRIYKNPIALGIGGV